jgi:hypothetical protein
MIRRKKKMQTNKGDETLGVGVSRLDLALALDVDLDLDLDFDVDFLVDVFSASVLIGCKHNRH